MTEFAAIPPVDFLGARLTPIDVLAAAAMIEARPPGAPFRYVVTPNAQHMVSLDRAVPGFREAYAHAWMTTCDSQILRLLARLLFGRRLAHCPGSDLTAHLLQNHIRPDEMILVIGGDDALAGALREKFGLTALTQHQPPMGLLKNPAAIEACVRFIVERPARYVFISCGSPQSEIIAHRTLLNGGAVGTGLCIGSSLHFATGLVTRAPVWMRRSGLEWLHRLLLNPRRHARRVFGDSFPVLLIALKTRLGLRSHAPAVAAARPDE
ncbi:glycosyltransferase [Oleomonas cavernae]|uniref:Glycosyltransferase n=2 Tax=Oleomonas cavernae TaxID=2320859 RepID=A0A418WJV7_9PROT|nr:glycosyltransferase [Oleomonas cavernae]